MINAAGIRKTYGKLEVLKGIDISVSKGEIVSIVGPSGAGKSTLLHILGTLDKPDHGSVEFENTRIETLNSKDLSRFRNQHVGFVFQFHQLLPEFSAVENVCIPAYIGGKLTKEAMNRAEELLAFLGLSERKEHKPAQLSGGEQQRVAVARALINNPSVVFADEPSGNLDSKSAESLHDLFFVLRKEFNQTFVIVTHNETLANRADRKITLVDGKLSQ